MISCITKLRVQYCDTDQMGFAHHSNYVKYFELARMELLRNIGVSCVAIEDAGFIMPVIDVSIHYNNPAFFDDELIIETQLPNPKGAKIVFHYKISKEQGKLICKGEVVLAFAGKENKQACRPPACFMDAVHCAESHGLVTCIKEFTPS